MVPGLSLIAALLVGAVIVPAQDAAVVLPRRIDLIAADGKGRQVESLTAADFAVLQNGVPQAIASAQFVREPGRIIGLFLDDFHTPPGAAAERARDALLRLVRTRLDADDRIAVVKPLDSLLAISWGDGETAARAIESFVGRRGDYAPLTDFERNFLAGAPARIEAARHQIAVSALNALAIHLGTVPQGRKTLLVVSGGLPPKGRLRGDEPLPTLDSVARAANRNHVAVYPIDVNDDGGAAADPARDALRTVANETSGRTLAAGDNLDAALDTVLSEASGYYVVTLQPDGAEKPDDRFHPVDITTTRKGVMLRTRGGYWAAVPVPLVPTPSSRDSMRRSRVVNKISPLVRPWFGMAPGNDGATRVSFVWEPAPRIPGDRSRVPQAARVALNVVREDTGKTVFEGAVLPSLGAGDSTDAGETRATFELPPGRLRVSMSIQDATSRQLDTDVREVTVGSFPGPLTLGTLQVLRVRNAREFRAVVANLDIAPVATRQFSRSERLLIRVPLYAQDVPVVSARLVSRFGAMRTLETAAWPDSTGYQVDVPLSGLAAGEYVVEVTASNEGGTARDSVAFRVTP